jgi:SAM-dependent methyltransferase
MRSPPPYNIESGQLLGDMLICWGFLLRTLDLKPGQSVLEYGPGSGQILLQFARMGVRAAGVDIDPVQTRFIREQGNGSGWTSVPESASSETRSSRASATTWSCSSRRSTTPSTTLLSSSACTTSWPTTGCW